MSSGTNARRLQTELLEESPEWAALSEEEKMVRLTGLDLAGEEGVRKLTRIAMSHILKDKDFIAEVGTDREVSLSWIKDTNETFAPYQKDADTEVIMRLADEINKPEQGRAASPHSVSDHPPSGGGSGITLFRRSAAVRGVGIVIARCRRAGDGDAGVITLVDAREFEHARLPAARRGARPPPRRRRGARRGRRGPPESLGENEQEQNVERRRQRE